MTNPLKLSKFYEKRKDLREISLLINILNIIKNNQEINSYKEEITDNNNQIQKLQSEIDNLKNQVQDKRNQIFNFQSNIKKNENDNIVLRNNNDNINNIVLNIKALMAKIASKLQVFLTKTNNQE